MFNPHAHAFKEKAIQLRKEGLVYAEILERIPVAKSTLSLWLRSAGLANIQHQRITEKRIAAQKRASEACHRKRQNTQAEIYRKAEADIETLSPRESWLIGVALYWAEGAKEKEWRSGSGMRFSNSDAFMLKLFLKWLHDTFNINAVDLSFSLFIHQNNKYRIPEVLAYWTRELGVPMAKMSKVYYKKHVLNPKRKNIGAAYYGQIQVTVKKSSTMVRKVAGWVRGINKFYWGIV